jgi:hypothetical protein
VALSLSGALGVLSERIRDAEVGQTPRLRGLPLAKIARGVSGMGLLGTAAEAGLLHFRGAFHDVFMVLPVTLPPIAGLAILGRVSDRLTRLLLRATLWLGFAGVGFHALGVARNMGGWRNWTQNLLNGPPLPAPPSFTALALAGLAALDLPKSPEA